MPTVNRHLVTTSIEETWGHNEPILFLGEWCRLYSRRAAWQNLNSIIATPYGLYKEIKDLDDAQVKRIKDELFPNICLLLNAQIGVSYTERFWKILIGHWFDYHSKALLNRFKTLENCLENFAISSISLMNSAGPFLYTPNNFESAIWDYSNQNWNEAIYAKIFHEISPPSIAIHQLQKKRVVASKKISPFGDLAPKKLLKQTWKALRQILGLVQNQSSPLIIGSYLPYNEEKALLKSFGLLPITERAYEFKLRSQPDFQLREKLSTELVQGNKDKYTKFIAKMVFELIPTCYLEDFSALSLAASDLPWPSRPRFIFTSNHFATDEIFKIWTAKKILQGTPYVTGQHGNNYGTHRYMNPSIEEESADHFITWGWSDNAPKEVPGFIFKLDGSQAQGYDPNGGLALIELHASLMVSTWDECAEFTKYFSEQKEFVARLNPPIRKCLTIRLHNDHFRLSWSEPARWLDFDPLLKVDLGNSPVSKLILSSRLLVFSYDSTGILEALSQNIPMVAFWQNGLDHLRDSAVPYYELLLEAKIIHKSPESAALLINSIWDDVEKWWQSEAIQGARLEFCKKYANLSQNPSGDLKRILDSL